VLHQAARSWDAELLLRTQRACPGEKYPQDGGAALAGTLQSLGGCSRWAAALAGGTQPRPVMLHAQVMSG
jgi:hypothetical protein